MSEDIPTIWEMTSACHFDSRDRSQEEKRGANVNVSLGFEQWQLFHSPRKGYGSAASFNPGVNGRCLESLPPELPGFVYGDVGSFVETTRRSPARLRGRVSHFRDFPSRRNPRRRSRCTSMQRLETPDRHGSKRGNSSVRQASRTARGTAWVRLVSRTTSIPTVAAGDLHAWIFKMM